jgi:hypothetical protein
LPVWLSTLIGNILIKLGSWLFAKGLEKYHGIRDAKETNDTIDARLKSFKNAYNEAFDGNPVSPEQREKLRNSIADFLRGPDGGGL